AHLRRPGAAAGTTALQGARLAERRTLLEHWTPVCRRHRYGAGSHRTTARDVSSHSRFWLRLRRSLDLVARPRAERRATRYGHRHRRNRMVSRTSSVRIVLDKRRATSARVHRRAVRPRLRDLRLHPPRRRLRASVARRTTARVATERPRARHAART